MSATMKAMRDQAASEGWGPAFPDSEYAERRSRVAEQMRAADIDTLLVTSPVNIAYLTGYDMIWYYLQTPTAVAIRADDQSTVFFDLLYHQPTVEYHAVVHEGCYFESFHHAVEVMVGALAGRGWSKGRVGIESWSRNPNGNVLSALTDALIEKGAVVVDGSWVADGPRLIKTPLELQAMRRAAAIADSAMRTVGDELRTGMNEMELAGIALAAMMREGGGDPAIRMAVRSGPRFVARHCAPSARKFGQGELVWVNFCGSYQRYHADLGRTFSLGEPDPRWTALVDRANSIATRVLGDIIPGDSTQVLQDAADAAVDAAGLRDQVVLVGGYDMGIAIPPDWVGHTFTQADQGFRSASYHPGMITNFEMLFKTAKGWRGGAGGGFIETIAMTGDGLEVLSGLGRSITVID